MDFELKKNTLNNIKLMRNFSFIDENNKKHDKRVTYSPNTEFNVEKKRSTTTFDRNGDIVRPIIVNHKYFIRRDQLHKLANFNLNVL